MVKVEIELHAILGVGVEEEEVMALYARIMEQ